MIVLLLLLLLLSPVWAQDRIKFESDPPNLDVYLLNEPVSLDGTTRAESYSWIGRSGREIPFPYNKMLPRYFYGYGPWKDVANPRIISDVKQAKRNTRWPLTGVDRVELPFFLLLAYNIREHYLRIALWMALASGVTYFYVRSRFLARRVQVLGYLLEGTRRLNASLEIKFLCNIAARTVEEMVFPHHSGYIWVKYLREPVCWGPSLDEPWLESLQNQVLDSGRLGESSHPDKGHTVLAPIYERNWCIGFAAVVTYDKALPGELAEIVQVYANSLGLAVANSRHYDEAVTARRELEQSQAQLMQSSKQSAMGQLGAGVAHELNSPLGAIMLSVDGILRKPDAPSVPTKAQRIKEATQFCQNIVSRLLTYTRHDTEKRLRVQLDQIASDAVQFSRAQLEAANIKTHVQLTPESWVEGKEGELLQAMLNLLQNVVDACPEGGNLWVACAIADGRVVCSVEDDGEGIPEEVRPRIFDPFFSTRGLGKRVGLGLTVALDVVQRHGGQLLFEPREPRGARFVVSLARA